ncbi:hypothetical protein M2401_005074 [Pseudomonas sp. JUb42]|jgi:hypothetical protein|uniref:hypothetical protein n=1 Tax=Pseudomonas sp. JUb42 TaxID=2940611 RepID=UPI00216A4167|nr:hypothetical protein [Pseudomonas sp. JUb42]MCS3471312.1 hypothetical protein [Pseudomonas sp. JUb42]
MSDSSQFFASPPQAATRLEQALNQVGMNAFFRPASHSTMVKASGCAIHLVTVSGLADGDCAVSNPQGGWF